MSSRVALKDIVYAAAGIGPGSLFKQSLSDLTALEWSEVCLAGIDHERPHGVVPDWVPAAALQALGFGRPAIDAAVEQWRGATAGTSLKVDRQSATLSSLQRADGAEPGMLVLIKDGDLPEATRKDKLDIPIFVLQNDRLSRYTVFLDRLAEVGAIKGIAHGRGGKKG